MQKLLICFGCLFSMMIFAVERDTLNTTNTSSKLLEVSDTDVSLLDQWQLSVQEWGRYEELMRGVRGRLSHPNISPIEVLGIHARSETERMHYARIWARMMRDDALRVLQFQRAYDIEAKALNEDEPLIDVSLLPKTIKHQDKVISESERVLVFLRLDCPLSDIVFDQVYQRVSLLHGIDTYFVDVAESDHDRVKAWARERGINAQHVQSGKVTINFDNGLLESIDPDRNSVPNLKRRKEDEIKPLTLDQLP